MPKARVLAVDDQRYFRELIEEFLSAEGFEAQTAASGEEALHILERSAFDIVLTDLVMPGMDGSELVHRVKSRNPEQDIVVVTGVVDVRTAVDAMKLGASDYLLKPFDRRALALCLDGILQKRRLQTRARAAARREHRVHGRAPLVRARARSVRLRRAPAARRTHRRGALPRDAGAGRRAVGAQPRTARSSSPLRAAWCASTPSPSGSALEQLPSRAARRAHGLAARAGGRSSAREPRPRSSSRCAARAA